MLFNFELCFQLWSMSQSSSARVTTTETTRCRRLTFIHIEKVLPHFSFSHLLLLASLSTRFFQVFDGKALFVAIGQNCYNRSWNLMQSCLLCQPARVFNNDLRWLIPMKMCVNFGIILHNIPFKQFTDTSSQAALTFLTPSKC